MDWIINRILENSATIRRTPVVFVLALVLGGTVGFAVADRLYSHELSSARQDRDIYKDKLESALVSGAGVNARADARSTKTANLGQHIVHDTVEKKPNDVATVGRATTGNSIGSISNNSGIVTQGQVGDNTIVQGLKPRHLDATMKAQFQANIPRTRKVTITSINETEPLEFSQEIFTFLKSKGYNVDPPAIGFFSKPVTKVEVDLHDDDETKPVEIIVGANLQGTTPAH